jgi:hypothetical protein
MGQRYRVCLPTQTVLLTSLYIQLTPGRAALDSGKSWTVLREILSRPREGPEPYGKNCTTMQWTTVASHCPRCGVARCVWTRMLVTPFRQFFELTTLPPLDLLLTCLVVIVWVAGLRYTWCKQLLEKVLGVSTD